MNLPNKPVPRDVYDTAVRLVMEYPVKASEKQAMLAWCECEKWDTYRNIAAAIVIHSATSGKETA